MQRGPSSRAEPAARLLLALAVLLGLARFLRLGDWGLWVDEAHTLHDAQAMFAGPLPKYPLGYLAVRLLVDLLGSTDEAVLRLFPAVCGFVSIPLAAWALRPAVGSTRAAAVALVLSLSSWHLFWSQSARAYTLALALSLFGGGLWLRGVLGGRGPKLAAGLVMGAAAAFAHPSAALLLPAWVLAPLLVERLGTRLRTRPPMVLLMGAAVLGALAMGGWVASVWGTYENVKGGSSLLHFVATTGWYMTPVALAGAAAGTWLAWRERRGEDLLVALVVGIVALAAAAASLKARVAAQYVFTLLPWVLALATQPLSRLARPGARAAWVALLCLQPAVDSVLYLSVRHGDRPRWKEAFAYVLERRGPDDLVLAMHAPVGEYYLNPGSTWLRSQSGLVKLDRSTLQEPERWLRHGRRMWVVLAPEDLAAWDPEPRRRLLELLADRGRLEAEFDVPWTPRDMLVRVYVVG
jgi:hypothetical protein